MSERKAGSWWLRPFSRRLRAQPPGASPNQQNGFAELVRAGLSIETCGTTSGATTRAKKRLLCFIVAYNAEKTIRDVLSRIPIEIAQRYETEILVIDDASNDQTFERSQEVLLDGTLSLPLTVLFNPVNQGYGGNQKLGYHYAIKHGFDYVALIHGDGQYAPECLPGLVAPLRDGIAAASFGSRMMVRGAAVKAGMPPYKFVGNKILTWIENVVLQTSLTEFHSGYRVYSVDALKQVPFQLNSNGFCFDTEIIIQLVLAGQEICEAPIPTYYGDEICHVNGLKYAGEVVRAVFRARVHRLGLLYDKRFDCDKGVDGTERYGVKLGYESPHSIAIATVPENACVLDLGCAGGYVGTILEQTKNCQVTGVDCFPLPAGVTLTRFRRHDLNTGLPEAIIGGCQYVLMLDVIEHLSSPERFVEHLREEIWDAQDVRILVSTGNIGFIANRIMLLLGKFDYGRRGILDMTHTRLFTFATLRKLFEAAGFDIIETWGVAAPFPVALGNGRLSRFLVYINKALIKLRRGLFSYQIFLVLRPQPSLDSLLANSERQAMIKAAAYRRGLDPCWATPAGGMAVADW